MSDYSNLSKEDLLLLLEKKNKKSIAEKQPVIEKPAVVYTSMCLYLPSRPKGAPQCTDISETPFGFCKKHAKTVQAKKAQEVYEVEHFLDDPVKVVEEDILKEEPVKIIEEPIKIIEQPIVKEEPVKIIEEPVKETQQSRHAQQILSPKKESVVATPKKIPMSSARHTEPLKGKAVPATRKKVIRPNYWGRYEDPDTRILFDPKTKCAYGVQEPSGRISSLKPEDIAVCKRNSWNYQTVDEDPSSSSSSTSSASSESTESDEDSVHDSDFDDSGESIDSDVGSDDSDSDDSDSDDDSDDSDKDSDDSDDDSDSDDSESDDDSDDDSDGDSDDSESDDDSDDDSDSGDLDEDSDDDSFGRDSEEY